MIRAFERTVFTEINIADRYLETTAKYTGNKIQMPAFSKKEILQMLKESGYPSEYAGQGGYVYVREADRYTFRLMFDVKNNLPLLYLTIYKDNEPEQTGITQLGSVLRYIPYNEALANEINEKGYNISSHGDFKNYVTEMALIFEDFVKLYIKKIEAGEIPQ